MPTDDERRRVTAALRRASVYTLRTRRNDEIVTEWYVALMSELANAVGLAADGGTDVFNRLADLIDPGDAIPGEACELAGAGEGEPLPPMVDREALLALADEMDRDGRTQRERQKAGERWFIDGLDVREYARRIREACGEVDG